MGVSASKVNPSNDPPQPKQSIYFVRYFGIHYSLQSFKIYFNNITQEQLQYYIIRPLHMAGIRYNYVNYDSLIIYDINPILFNNMFANLCLVETVDVIADAAVSTASPSAPPAEDPLPPPANHQ
jgi:hypothetical protein